MKLSLLLRTIKQANKFCKSQIRKYAGLNILVRFANLPQMWHFFVIYRYILSGFASCGPKLVQNKKVIWKDDSYDCSETELCSFFLEICSFGICGLIMKICAFAICRLAHLRNLRICDIRMSPSISRFSICGLFKKVCEQLLRRNGRQTILCNDHNSLWSMINMKRSSAGNRIRFSTLVTPTVCFHICVSAV
jgi:hypothetical protein